MVTSTVKNGNDLLRKGNCRSATLKCYPPADYLVSETSYFLRGGREVFVILLKPPLPRFALPT